MLKIKNFATLVSSLILSLSISSTFAATWSSMPISHSVSYLFAGIAAKFTVEQCTHAGQITGAETAIQAFSDADCYTPTGNVVTTEGFQFNCSETSCLGYSVNGDKLYNLLPNPAGVLSVMIVPRNSTSALSNSGPILYDPNNFCFNVDCSTTPGQCNYSGLPHCTKLQAGLAYYTNYGDTCPQGTTVCSIALDGSVTSCQDAGNFGNSIDTPTGITLNSERTKAYITNFTSNTVSVCNLDLGGKFVSCTNQGIFTQPVGITLNSDNSRAYISSNTGVSMCPIDGNGDLVDSSCVLYNPTIFIPFPVPAFINPHGLQLNSANDRIYVVNTNFGSDTPVTSCDVLPDGSIDNCQFSTSFGSGLVGIAVNSAETKAFITSSGNNSLYTCDISAGTLSNCQNSGQSSFDFPEYIAINSTNTFLYIANYSSNSTTVCGLDLLGVITSCAASSETISEAYGVYVTN
jgi:DNA-binding beta-propeller fold protein YncE